MLIWSSYSTVDASKSKRCVTCYTLCMCTKEHEMSGYQVMHAWDVIDTLTLSIHSILYMGLQYTTGVISTGKYSLHLKNVK